MKHDRSHRRDVRRHADPSLICLPGPKLPYTPPRGEPEAAEFPSSAILIPDDAALDAELLAHKNIFDAPPRISRQARRKALRAEQKAARRAVTERFLAGAPSLGQAAARYSVAAMPVAPAQETPDDVMAESVILADTGVIVMARPEIVETDMVSDETSEDIVIEAESLAAHFAQEVEEAVSLDTIAQLISATGPLIVDKFDAEEERIEESAPLPDIEALPEIDAAAPEDMESEPPEWLIQKSSASGVPIEAMTTPLPRNRALVPAKRSWLLRAVPWLTPGRRALAPQPALTELQDLRFELVGALQRLDRIIDRLPRSVTTAR